MTKPNADRPDVTVQKKWLWFGAVLSVLHLLFLGLVVALLRIDVVLAVIVTVVVSLVGGVAITAFVLWWK